MDRDEEIQSALDGPGTPAGPPRTPDEAAYQVVFAALREDDGFALPPDFADAMVARLMPAPSAPPIYERFVLPVLLAAACVMVVPTVIGALGGALAKVVGAPGLNDALPAVAVITLALLIVATADRLARRAGLTPA